MDEAIAGHPVWDRSGGMIIVVTGYADDDMRLLLDCGLSRVGYAASLD